MSEEREPRNRRERRAAAKESGKPMTASKHSPKIKMEQPDRSGPKTKTLLDVYEEKRELLDKGQPFDSKHNDGEVRDESGNILDAGLGPSEPLGPIEQAIFWAVLLSMLHFTLDVLVYNQYRQELEWWSIWSRTLTVFPILFLLIWLLKSETAKKFHLVKEVVCLAVATIGGCYLIHITNRYGYYAVMKQAPPVGTVWVWSVIEMSLPYALASVTVNLTFLFWKGHTIF
ncbi:hypothetical protein K431DRAFT_339444 [Polychaeton citri CBS 116435]|uniref:DUF7719 domain-containing protein n=1 Tax=Polychaeton citri CBS 116435 TaxID=1314669 RepID=A0A9P4Q6D4_9PEZI|nr:hypothetical protein K431DRAFT_339444 [Polychaeton citri CBS 116435]